MSTESGLEQIKNLLLPLLEDDVFLVDLKTKPTNNFKIYLDADGGLPIEKCIKINRALYKQIEETGMYPDGNFSLEVSSPGLDEPLKLKRQYKKNVGRDVEVTLQDETKIEGLLSSADENIISLEVTEGKGRKAEQKKVEINFEDIKHTKIQIKF